MSVCNACVTALNRYSRYKKVRHRALKHRVRANGTTKTDGKLIWLITYPQKGKKISTVNGPWYNWKHFWRFSKRQTKVPIKVCWHIKRGQLLFLKPFYYPTRSSTNVNSFNGRESKGHVCICKLGIQQLHLIKKCCKISLWPRNRYLLINQFTLNFIRYHKVNINYICMCMYHINKCKILHFICNCSAPQ